MAPITHQNPIATWTQPTTFLAPTASQLTDQPSNSLFSESNNNNLHEKPFEDFIFEPATSQAIHRPTSVAAPTKLPLQAASLVPPPKQPSRQPTSSTTHIVTVTPIQSNNMHHHLGLHLPMPFSFNLRNNQHV